MAGALIRDVMKTWDTQEHTQAPIGRRPSLYEQQQHDGKRMVKKLCLGLAKYCVERIEKDPKSVAITTGEAGMTSLYITRVTACTAQVPWRVGTWT